MLAQAWRSPEGPRAADGPACRAQRLEGRLVLIEGDREQHGPGWTCDLQAPTLPLQISVVLGVPRRLDGEPTLRARLLEARNLHAVRIADRLRPPHKVKIAAPSGGV